MDGQWEAWPWAGTTAGGRGAEEGGAPQTQRESALFLHTHSTHQRLPESALAPRTSLTAIPGPVPLDTCRASGAAALTCYPGAETKRTRRGNSSIKAGNGYWQTCHLFSSFSLSSPLPSFFLPPSPSSFSSRSNAAVTDPPHAAAGWRCQPQTRGPLTLGRRCWQRQQQL